ncbi:MAG: DUF3738 domain-containing protein [Acidobacteria bacterium]|nr:DUF3738 domain-containing protein [Acidobacteriota bacterium]
MKRSTTAQLADMLARLLVSPVADRTELKERYDSVIDIPPPADPQDRDQTGRVMGCREKAWVKFESRLHTSEPQDDAQRIEDLMFGNCRSTIAFRRNPRRLGGSDAPSSRAGNTLGSMFQTERAGNVLR